MLTVGIDLSADRSKTAVAVVDWRHGAAFVETPRLRCTDEELVDLIADLSSDDRVGIDTPFGWPAEFVRAVSAHLAGSQWPGRGQDSERYRKDHLRYRLTDQLTWERLRPLSPPLPAPFDRIGAMVARWAHLEDALRARGCRIDRAGTGRVCEVYPKASRHQWQLSKERSMGDLVAAAPWVRCDSAARAAYDASEHAFDALVCALTARAVALKLTLAPTGTQLEAARAEGWIHMPNPGSFPQLPE
ncbi:DUF429 domain-containing protein [Streptacidiphilus sp. MAP5-3]|uniref:DUF429 domain-containing protein n=1 Tax=unclassified Streptacidiphilus TaxID=2643834 RepID=UPI003517A5A6